MNFERPELPLFFRLRQSFDETCLTDIEGEVAGQLERSGVARQIRPGQTVAITAGSRGIANIHRILKAIAAYFQQLGAQPFLVPAMGSHGGGTAEGQRQVIESYGVTEAYCGCPIRSSMETVVIAQADEGFPVFFDRHAFEADHVVVCGRIKPHTNFAGDIQSGLMKMLMIGLGKKDGAALYHRAIHEHGFPQIIRSVAPQVLRSAKILAGVAIVENARDETALIEAVLPADFMIREQKLLQTAIAQMPRLPFNRVDLLIVDQIGKNISGTGMDTNIIGRKRSEPADRQPHVKRIIVRGLTAESHGNGCGLGLADFCLTRAIEQMDRRVTVLNCLTACDVSGAMIPVDFPTDAELLAAATSILGFTKPRDARILWIHNTLDLVEIECSAALLDEARGRADLEVMGPLHELPVGPEGMLPDWCSRPDDPAKSVGSPGRQRAK